VITLKSLIFVHRRTTIEEEDPDQRKSWYSFSRRNVLAKKKYKVDLTEHTFRPYSFMLVSMQKQKEGDFVADVAFLSSSSDSDFIKDENIESIKESELADLIKKYRVFVECIKTVEQKKLSRRTKKTFRRINLRSFIQQIAKGMNATHMKKAMIANGIYIKKATINTVNAKKVASDLISDFNELKNNSIKREIHTKMNIDGTLVTTTSTIELDADIVTVIQKQPEIRDTTIRNFVLSIHMSNVSLSTFFLLNKVNQIFSNCGMIIGFGRMATTPVSIYNMLLISPDPFSIVYAALPTGFFVLIPRIARLIIRYRIKKRLYYRQ
jgi:hypothetical protein